MAQLIRSPSPVSTKSEKIAAEVLEALAVLGAHHGRGLEVEAVYTGLQLPIGLAVVVGIGALGSVLVCATACGRAREGQAQRPLVGVVVVQSASLEELVHALGDGRAERLEPVACRRFDGCEGTERVVHTVHVERMEVNVQREVAPEPLHGGDAARASVGDAAGVGDLEARSLRTSARCAVSGS